ncbi:GNAT family N-acetyltransferase [Chamaesiphon sp. VAR_48_metabat_403]|uniref:GNAT family N-acetyltransferase n=1 Tax=Chamaesiphon sp. VAR_48_metabat_403 TaxID=2964700 RepID=UPI00286E626D|nr:GNAT family N-acetyltransferase [Chamaesiphon sp. VAR_48_metabat_403]
MTNSSKGKIIVSTLKDNAGLSRSEICIPVGEPVRCLLRPVATHPNLLNQNDISNLTVWRNRFVNSFLTEFTATEQRTANWLTEVVRYNESKILFMLDDLQGTSFGYMGLDFIDWNNRYGEADAIVRGGDATHGTMKIALQTLINWSQNYLGLLDIGVRVRSDNTALKFYQKAGFHELHRIPLERNHQLSITNWIENKSITGTISLVHMRYRKLVTD